MISTLTTTIVAALVGGGLATVAALGIVASEQSAGTEPVSSQSVSYDGS